MKPALRIMYDQNIDDFGHLEPDEIGGLTVYAEARGESNAGRIAVATVILERVDKQGWMGKDIEEVCLMPFQFSCYLVSDPNRPKLLLIAKNFKTRLAEDRVLSDCFNAFHNVAAGIVPRDPDLAKAHCCQYLTTQAKAGVDWWKKMKFIKKIGSHEFYS